MNLRTHIIGSVATAFALALFGPAAQQQQCYSWTLPEAVEPVDTLAWIVLRDTSTTPDGWQLAEIRGPRIAGYNWQRARWRSFGADSVNVTWTNPFTHGSYRLARTPTGLSGTMTWFSDVHVRDSTGTYRPYQRTERVLGTVRPCPR